MFTRGVGKKLIISGQEILEVAVIDGAGAQVTSFGGSANQYTEGDVDSTITGNAIMFESNEGTNTLSTVNATTPLPVAVISGGVGGIQYTEDAAAAANPVGNAVIFVRKDTPGAEVSADGDNIAQRGTNFGAGYVTLLDTSGNPVAVGGGTQYTEDAAAAANPIGNALIGVRADTLGALTSADGDNVAARFTDKGEQYVKHVDAIPITDNAGSLTVDNAGTFAVQATIAAAATSIAKAEDAASASADVGVPAMAIQLATPTDLAGTDADYAMLQMSAGRLWVSAKVDTALPTGANAIGKLAANSGVDIGDVDVTTVGTITPGTAATSLGKAEDAAHASSDVGVMALAVRSNTAASTSGTDGDYQPLITNTTGHLWVDASGQTLTVGSHAVTNAGTFAVQATLQANSGVDIGKLTANQSVNVAQINGVTPLMGVGATGTGASRVVIANDYGKTLVSTGGSAASSGNNTLIAAGANKTKVYAFSLSTLSTTAVTCIFQSGASGTEIWRCVLQAPTGVGTGANLAGSVNSPLFMTAAATLLNLNLSSANAVHWSVSYYDEA